MRVSSIHLKNFKRFTDLLIRDIPASAKLVVVVGPNGCGKSSLFDAFYHWYRQMAKFGINQDESYFIKNKQSSFDWERSVEVNIHDNTVAGRGSLYIRTAYRNDPDFNIKNLSHQTSPSEGIRLQRFIDDDKTVSENYQRLVYDTTAAIYDTANNEKTVQDLREELIGQIRISMKNVFGDLLLKNISDPLGSGSFFFEKGAAKDYHYKNLSGGEKAAFDLILDLHIKKKYFPDAIYCVDEAETHLHTRVQGSLVREMVNIIPADSQLWITTHSLGVLRAAQELEVNAPGTVCVLDFDEINFDEQNEITPSILGRIAWEKMLSIAVDDLSQQIAPKVVMICEGSSVGNRRKDFDAEIYNKIFSPHVPDVLFISGGNSLEVAKNGFAISKAIGQILSNTRIVALADRDDKSDSEVSEWEENGNIILSERNLESYLFADDVIQKLVESKDSTKFEAAIKIKTDALEASAARDNAGDDLKSAAGNIYTGLKTLLELQRCGNNTDAFMRDTLAPFLQPGMDTYESLKTAIIDKLQGGTS